MEIESTSYRTNISTKYLLLKPVTHSYTKNVKTLRTKTKHATELKLNINISKTKENIYKNEGREYVDGK